MPSLAITILGNVVSTAIKRIAFFSRHLTGARGIEWPRSGQILKVYRGHFHVDVNAVQKRPGNTLTVALDLNQTASPS